MNEMKLSVLTIYSLVIKKILNLF